MPTDMIDDGDGWKVPAKNDTEGRVLAARVRYLQAAFAQQVMAIPADASKQSRAIRMGKVRNRISEWLTWMNTTHHYGPSGTVKVTHDRERRAWFPAESTAWNTVRAAMDAGEDLSAFLFPQEEVDIAA